MARTDYGAILSTVIKDTSDSIREVNKTSALIAPNAWATNIRTMKSASAYQKALDALKAKTIEKTPIASFNDGAEGVPFNEVLAYITATQSGTGTPSPTNIRSINGHTQAVVTRTRVTLWSYGNVSGTRYSSISVNIRAGTYNISAVVTSSDTDASNNIIGFLYADGTFIYERLGRNTRDNTTVILEQDVNLIRFYASDSNVHSADDTFTFADIQLQTGNTATTYEPYTGNTYTTPFGQTIYGGVLNVTTGELTITHGFITYDGSENWQYQNTGYSLSKPTGCSVTSSTVFCYANQAVQTTDNSVPNGTIRIGASNIITRLGTGNNDVPAFKAWLASNPLQLVYPLATPITIQLTPQEIEQYLQNTLWASTGDIAVTYLANANVITDESLPFKNIVTFEARSGHTPTGFLLFRNGSYHFFMYMINGDEFYYDTATGKIKRSYFYYTDPDEVSNYFPMTYGAGDWSGQDGGDITCTQAELTDYFFYRTYDIKDQNGNVLLPANCTLADFGF